VTERTTLGLPPNPKLAVLNCIWLRAIAPGPQFPRSRLQPQPQPFLGVVLFIGPPGWAAAS